MATKRFRNGKYHYVVKNKKLLPKPLYFTYADQAEGDAYVDDLEQLLAKGVVPIEFQSHGISIKLHQLINDYVRTVAITDDRRKLLELAKKRIQNIDISMITYKWGESWVKDMKRVRKLVPSTITKHVGALSCCLDWAVNHHLMTANPLRSLPRGYSNYTDEDSRIAGVRKKNTERDRRLEPGEEDRILAVIDGKYKPEDRQRWLKPEPAIVYKTFFLLALETAMRMRELYTLSVDQIKFEQKTIILDDTKNGDDRQVPMSSPAIKLLREYIAERNLDGYLFPEFFDGNFEQRALEKNTYRVSRLWGRVFQHAECPDFNFHDTRHEATSRLYERTSLSDLQISEITGHRTLTMLKRYANLRGSVLADKLW